MEIRGNNEIVAIVMHTETELMNLYGLSLNICIKAVLDRITSRLSHDDDVSVDG